MLKIKNLTVRNFLSVGNVTQSVDFDRNDLTLVLGENLDLGGDGNRNGTGKTSIANALSYVIFGQALTNIKRDNLINKTNAKGMLVTIEFEKDGRSYRIERGRRPGVLTLYQGTEAYLANDSDAQGDSRETQLQINKIIGMSPDMFKHVVALNTYTDPFLNMKASDQRAIIEQLLGITMLSEKAELLKEQIRFAKEFILGEEYRIKSVIDANKKIEEQLGALRRRSILWDDKHKENISKLTESIIELSTLDIEAELQGHILLSEYLHKKKEVDDLTLALGHASKDLARETKMIDKLVPEIETIIKCTCHACGQALPEAIQEQNLKEKEQILREHIMKSEVAEAHIKELTAGLESIGTLSKPTVFYTDAKDAYNHKSTLEHLKNQLEELKKDENPYGEQIHEMETTALAVVDYSAINARTKVKEHQEFLLKLLTNKDSFVRKRIIDQNLTYLNARLSYFLDQIGLPHTVVFQNDLTVSIEELGRELDFDNLSRGERGRLILSLSWAFRNVWESLYSSINLLFIDELIDNGLDTSGVESAMAILKKMSRDTHKSIWLVSHKDELVSRVNNTLLVVKSGGFTSYTANVE